MKLDFVFLIILLFYIRLFFKLFVKKHENLLGKKSISCLKSLYKL